MVSKIIIPSEQLDENVFFVSCVVSMYSGVLQIYSIVQQIRKRNEYTT